MGVFLYQNQGDMIGRLDGVCPHATAFNLRHKPLFLISKIYFSMPQLKANKLGLNCANYNLSHYRSFDDFTVRTSGRTVFKLSLIHI